MHAGYHASYFLLPSVAQNVDQQYSFHDFMDMNVKQNLESCFILFLRMNAIFVFPQPLWAFPD